MALWREEERSAEARAKAREFIAELNAAGIAAPSEEAAARLFGVDGGQFTQNLDEDLHRALYAWQLGTAGPAGRPVILDEDFVTAADAFVRIYVKDKAAASEFREWLHRLETGNTID
ncbi:MAG: hypothetical protein GX624_12500 [Actinobacteria bacterium]|nr:hypothetical protein [Actinomycetota bacterium]